MTDQNKNQFNDVANDLNSRLQGAIEKGNARRVIVRKANGESLINVTLTTAVIVGAIGMIFLTELTMLVLILSVAAGVYYKAKIEVVSVVEDTDTPNIVTTEKSPDDSDVQSAA